MPIRMVHHINIATTQLAETRAFYVDVLGLEEGPRPSLRSEGYWFYAGGSPIVHIQRSPADVSGSSASALNHAAFLVDDLDAVIARLQAHGVPCRVVDLPDGSGRQAFFEDPNGVRLELNAPATGERR